MVINASNCVMNHANVRNSFSSIYLVATKQRKRCHVGSHCLQSLVISPVIKYCSVGTNVLAIASHVTGEGYTNVAVLNVIVCYLVAISASFRVLTSVLLAANPVKITAVIIGVQTSVVNHVFPVQRIVSGSVSILSVPRNVVRSVIALVAIVHVLSQF